MPDVLHDMIRLPWPANWAEVFGRPAALVVEIGFGDGTFLIDLARRFPEHNVLGLEISSPSLERGQRKMQKASLSNVRFVYGDAFGALWLLFAPASLQAMYINFPDPWPKAVHAKRRLISDRFLALAATRLATGGRLEVATDDAPYAQAIADGLEGSDYYASTNDGPFVTEIRERLPTKYERLARDEGRPSYYFRWRRNRRPAAEQYPVPKETPMPHVVLETQLTISDFRRGFRRRHTSRSGTHVTFLEVYQAQREGKLLIETYLGEPALEQRVALDVQRRGDALVIGLGKIGFPRSTPGVQLAIQAAADFVCELDPQARVRSSNLGSLP